MQILLLVPVIVGIVAIRKYGFNEHAFYLMFIVATCGLGFYYNDMFRMGPIFPSDLFLVVFFAIWLYRNNWIICGDRQTLTILIALVIFEMAIGILSKNFISEILTDFKYVLYFFIPYLYLKESYYDREKNKSVFFTYVFCVAFTLILNWMNFFNAGLRNIYSGGNEIIRTFGIGMGFACGSFCTGLLACYTDKFVSRFGALLYYIIHIILILSCLASATRTSWISYALTVTMILLVVGRNKITRSGAFHAILSVLVISILLYIIYRILLKVSPAVIEAINIRMASISETTTDKDNTFYARILDVLAGADVFFSPKIIWGYGYGSLYTNRSGYSYSGLENSYVYYLWKYGIFMGMYLFYRVIGHLKKTWKTGLMANRIFVIFFIFSAGISSLSGNLNSTYPIGMYAVLFCINYGLIFDYEKIPENNLSRDISS